jgi:hypothetical protein
LRDGKGGVVHRDNEALYVQDIPRKQIWNVKEIPFFNETASSNNPHNMCRLELATRFYTADGLEASILCVL